MDALDASFDCGSWVVVDDGIPSGWDTVGEVVVASIHLSFVLLFATTTLAQQSTPFPDSPGGLGPG